MASRTVLFPLKEKETLLTPPLTLAWGKFSRIHCVALKKSSAFFDALPFLLQQEKYWDQK